MYVQLLHQWLLKIRWNNENIYFAYPYWVWYGYHHVQTKKQYFNCNDICFWIDIVVGFVTLIYFGYFNVQPNNINQASYLELNIVRLDIDTHLKLELKISIKKWMSIIFEDMKDGFPHFFHKFSTGWFGCINLVTVWNCFGFNFWTRLGMVFAWD